MARTRSRRREGRSPFTVGLIALIVILILVFLGFTKDIPFTRPYQVKAVFQSSNSLRPDSPVRIAGVEVGKVKKVEAQEGTDAAVVTMSINKSGLPLHADATAKIRPRIFLEGNFFVDLQPGTPGAPELDDGETIKVTQTSTPVQLDQVLTALQSDTRQDLRDVLEGLGTALNSEPSAADDRDADQSGARRDRRGVVQRRLRRRRPGRALAVAGQRGVPRPRARGGPRAADRGRREDRRRPRAQRDPAQGAGVELQHDDGGARLRGRRTCAPRSASSRQTLENANAAFASLNEAFPPTRAFAREILPGVRETAATIDASFPWIEQMRGLMSKAELQGLARTCRPRRATSPKLTDQAIELLPQTDLASKCASRVVLPTGDVVIKDEFQTGRENYKDFFYAMVGLAGEGQNFDGNGMYVRFQTGGGSQQVSLGQGSAGSPPQFGGLPTPPLGNRPFYPGKLPPYKSSEPCYKQKLPDLNGPAAAKVAPNQGAATATSTARAARLRTLRSKIRPFGSKPEASR